MEIWKPIPGYETLYEVSNYGRVRSLMKKQGTRPGRIVKPRKHNAGYLSVGLYGKEKPSYRLVHTLVLEAFVGPRPDGMVSHHRDANRHNNRLENLEWISPSDNIAHAYRTFNTASRNRSCGEEHGASKLTEEQVSEIRQLYASGEYSQVRLAAMFNIVQPHISRIVRSESWSHIDHNHSE